MHKVLALCFVIFASVIVAGCFSAIFDQLIYSVSPEYYTMNKFHDFWFGRVGLDRIVGPDGEVEIIAGNRLGVAVEGILSFWWVGLMGGLVLGIFGIFNHYISDMLKHTARAGLVILVIVILVATIGYIIGMAGGFDNFSVPNDNLNDPRAYRTAGMMHIFKGIGAILGIPVGLIYVLRQL